MAIPFSPALFWDSDIQNMDITTHRNKIIVRVLERGNWEDFEKLKMMYDKQTLKEAVLNARSLDKYTLAFCSAIFEEPKEKFRCYTTIEFRKNAWEY